MERVANRYVQFYTFGAIVGESWTDAVERLDPYQVQWPNNAYAFTLHEREDVVDGDKRYTGEPRQVGPMYYHPDSVVQTIADVAGNPKATRILLENMRCNKWNAIVWSRWGNWPQPFDSEKCVVLEKQDSARTE